VAKYSYFNNKVGGKYSNYYALKSYRQLNIYFVDALIYVSSRTDTAPPLFPSENFTYFVGLAAPDISVRA
jgi:hypothetical protein